LGLIEEAAHAFSFIVVRLFSFAHLKQHSQLNDKALYSLLGAIELSIRK
jgi:hypothetical protein